MRSWAIGFVLLSISAWGQEGERIYQSQCSFCHGQQGEGGRGPSLNRSRLRLAPDDAALQRLIRVGTATGMPRTALNEKELTMVAGFVRQLGRTTSAPVVGDAERGRRIYREKGKCDGCHTIQGRGGAFGPDLTGIGNLRSPAHLMQSLLEPAADVAPGFVLIHAVTQSGQRVDGARVNEDTFSVQIRDVRGTVHSFWKQELRELKKDRSASAMPSFRALTPGELQDLVAYLATLEEGQ